MILKMKFGASWKLIDNIDEIHTFPPGDEEYVDDVKLVVQYSHKSEILTQPLTETAYILNDNGKTIERLVL